MATPRVAKAVKAEIPCVDDPVGKLEDIGDKTKEKLNDLPAAAETCGALALKLPFTGVTTGGSPVDARLPIGTVSILISGWTLKAEWLNEMPFGRRQRWLQLGIGKANTCRIMQQCLSCMHCQNLGDLLVSISQTSRAGSTRRCTWKC